VECVRAHASNVPDDSQWLSNTETLACWARSLDACATVGARVEWPTIAFCFLTPVRKTEQNVAGCVMARWNRADATMQSHDSKNRASSHSQNFRFIADRMTFCKKGVVVVEAVSLGCVIRGQCCGVVRPLLCSYRRMQEVHRKGSGVRVERATAGVRRVSGV
jgi:hypothetical protein